MALCSKANHGEAAIYAAEDCFSIFSFQYSSFTQLSVGKSNHMSNHMSNYTSNYTSDK